MTSFIATLDLFFIDIYGSPKAGLNIFGSSNIRLGSNRVM